MEKPGAEAVGRALEIAAKVRTDNPGSGGGRVFLLERTASRRKQRRNVRDRFFRYGEITLGPLGFPETA